MRLGGAVFVVSLAAAGLPAIAAAQTPVQWSIAPLPASTSTSTKPTDATLTAVIDEGWKVYSSRRRRRRSRCDHGAEDQRFSRRARGRPVARTCVRSELQLRHRVLRRQSDLQGSCALSGRTPVSLPSRPRSLPDVQSKTLSAADGGRTTAADSTTGNDGLRQVTTGSGTNLRSLFFSWPGARTRPRDLSSPVVTRRHPSSPTWRPPAPALSARM